MHSQKTAPPPFSIPVSPHVLPWKPLQGSLPKKFLSENREVDPKGTQALPCAHAHTHASAHTHTQKYTLKYTHQLMLFDKGLAAVKIINDVFNLYCVGNTQLKLCNGHI